MPLTLNHDDQLAHRDEVTAFTASVTVSNADFTLDKAAAGSTAIYAKQNGSNRFALNVESDGWSMYSNDGTTWSQGMFMSNGGIVAKPNNPGFYARGNTSQWQTQTTNVWLTPVSGIGDTGDGVRWGHNMTTSGTGCFNSGHYSVSTGRFTAPISGQYCFSYSFHSNVPNNVDYGNANFLINGNFIKGTLTQGGYYFTKAGAAAEFMGKTTATFYLNSGDYVELQLNNPTGSVRYYSDYIMFSGHFIG